jgi:hypothetical protein
MSSKKDIIDYKIVLNLLLFSILIYKIDENNKEKNLINILNNKNIFKDNFLLLEKCKDIDKNDYIIKYFNCEITHMYCMIIRNDINKYIKIIFRGSSKNIHMKYNLKINLKRIKFLNNNNIKIHNGFYQQIFKGKLYNNIITFLKTLKINDYMIYYSGYSLGGNMSVLFGYFSSYVFTKNKIIIVTFGGSKVGNNHFKESFNNVKNIICYRFCNENDIITQLPLINYEHIGISITLKSNKFNLLSEHSYNTYLNNLLNDTW